MGWYDFGESIQDLINETEHRRASNVASRQRIDLLSWPQRICWFWWQIHQQRCGSKTDIGHEVMMTLGDSGQPLGLGNLSRLFTDPIISHGTPENPTGKKNGWCLFICNHIWDDDSQWPVFFWGVGTTNHVSFHVLIGPNEFIWQWAMGHYGASMPEWNDPWAYSLHL